MHTEHIPTVVIGGGQAGLAVGYNLRRQGVPFVILDASQRIGDAWRKRWDSLRLFSPAAFNGLPGMRFPAPGHRFVTKDEMADFLEQYAARFELPVRLETRVEQLDRAGDRFIVDTSKGRIEADNVVVAMSSYQKPRVPSFAAQLDPEITQLHSSEYCNPNQLQPGGVLIVGAGNSGAEIAVELATTHPTWVAGPKAGAAPLRTDTLFGRVVVARLFLGIFFHHVLTLDTPVGRKARKAMLHRATPLVRTREPDMLAAGVKRVGRVTRVESGRPVLEDGTVLDVRNVVWCTGYHAAFDWIRLPIHGEHEPLHERGIVPSQPGLFFVGLHFLYALSSAQVHGVGRDAARVARAIKARAEAPAAARHGVPAMTPAA